MKTPRDVAVKVADLYRATLVSGGRPNFIDMVEAGINEFKEVKTQSPTCKDHPKYQGLRTPHQNCEGCWRLYIYNKDNKNG